ncbi:MAG: hypothetical protein ABIP03_03555 [Aquihabitans sp.]
MTAALLTRHRGNIKELSDLAQRDIALLLAPVSGDAVAARLLLEVALPDLVSVYGSAAATLGAEMYDELRYEAKVTGRFVARPAVLPGLARTASLAKWAVDPLFAATPDSAAATERVGGGLQRIIANADRETVMGSSIADPKAQGWKRLARTNGCGFCRMLASRGAVYTKTSVDFGAHDHCGCVAAPQFGGDVVMADRKPVPADIPDAQVAATEAWMADHGY